MLPCWRIGEMKALVVFCVLMNEFVFTTKVSTSTVKSKFLHCDHDAVIQEVNITCGGAKCPLLECTNRTENSFNKECHNKPSCVVDFPSCIFQERHINLSYICHGYGHFVSTKTAESVLSNPTIFGSHVCLTFFYNLGRDSSIDIFRTFNNNKNDTPIRSVTYSSNNLQSLPWKYFNTTVYHESDDYSISLVAKIYNKYGFVGIDDIDVVPGKCEDMFKELETFENSSYTSNLIFQGQTLANESHCPKTDHTTFSDKGHYLVVAGRNRIMQKQFQFISFNARTQVCLTFWYTAKAIKNLSLNASLRIDSKEDTFSFPIKITDGSWSMLFKTVTVVAGELSLSFDRSTVEGCIAVDDISLNKGTCEDFHVNEWFQSGVNQLKCPLVNIPDKRVNILTQPQYDVDDTQCQDFVRTLENNIRNFCKGTFEKCQINRDTFISEDVVNDCLTQLADLYHTVDANHSCTGTQPFTKPQTLVTSRATSEQLFETTEEQNDQTKTPSTEHRLDHLITVTSSEQLYTTDIVNDDIRASSLESSGNSGLIVGVVVGLLFMCLVVVGVFLFRKRFSFSKTKECKEDNPRFNTRPKKPRDVQEYDYLGNRNSKDHIYNTASDHVYNTTSDHVYNIPSDKDLDGVVYTSIDYEPLPATISHKEVNTPPNKGLSNDSIMFTNLKPIDVNERSQQADSHPAYAVLDPSVTGFNHREKSEKETKVCLSNDKKAEPDKCNDFDPQKLNSEGRLSENPRVTGIDRSKSHTIQSCDLPDDYSVLDPSITGFDRTNEKEATTVNNNGDDYAVLDPNETGFQNSVQIDEDIEGTECYTILDPTETGFDRSNTMKNDGILNKNDVYELAKPLPTQSEYAICPKEGNYDILGSERETSMDEEHIYNHAPDSVYDTTSHVRAKDKDEETYDHFTGHT